ncbi:hypothetical protein ACM66B_004290 [Microbotryomycetes sp. NB124-2]
MPLNPAASVFTPVWTQPVYYIIPPSNANAPACQLSEQAQDLILDTIRDTSSALVAEKTFAAVCLTSRHWLEAGQRALYRSPLAARPAQWKRAHALAATLRSRLGLAAQVRDLRMLGRRVAELGYLVKSEVAKRGKDRDRNKPQKKPEHGGSRSRWALELIRLCPLVKVVGVPLGTALKVQDVIDSMTQSVEHIEIVRVGKLSHAAAYEEVNRLVCSRKFQSLHLRNFDHAQTAEQEEMVQFRVPEDTLNAQTIEEVSIDNSLEDFLLRRSLFNQPAVHINNLQIRTKALTDGNTGVALVRRLIEAQGEHLQTLKIDSNLPKDKRKVYIETYGIVLKGLLDCVELRGVRWQSLTSLTRLELHACHGLEFVIIENILSQLAGLKCLSLDDSIWIPENDEHDDFEHALLEHLDVVSTLSPALEVYRLGVLPFSTRATPDELVLAVNVIMPNLRVDYQVAKRGGFRHGTALSDREYITMVLGGLTLDDILYLDEQYYDEHDFDYAYDDDSDSELDSESEFSD